ncbi:hypothetical protein [Lysinibacter cavernae]|uniref:hypothetical protein n=1 Tax=Lysinibacter cavernae TaxID=1640652 RepID=UPI003616B827
MMHFDGRYTWHFRGRDVTGPQALQIQGLLLFLVEGSNGSSDAVYDVWSHGDEQWRPIETSFSEGVSNRDLAEAGWATLRGSAEYSTSNPAASGSPAFDQIEYLKVAPPKQPMDSEEVAGWQSVEVEKLLDRPGAVTHCANKIEREITQMAGLRGTYAKARRQRLWMLKTEVERLSRDAGQQPSS